MEARMETKPPYSNHFGSIVGNLFSTSRSITRRAIKHLGPVIEERMRLYDETGGDWPDKPVCRFQLYTEAGC